MILWLLVVAIAIAALVWWGVSRSSGRRPLEDPSEQPDEMRDEDRRGFR